jgi:hypothetical protein
LASAFASAADCDAEELDADPAPEGELEQAAMANTASADAAPAAAPRENRRDIRMPAVLPCRVLMFQALKFSALYTADFCGEEPFPCWSTTL